MKRVCDQGHHFKKTSDCPTCPQCEKEKWMGSNWEGLSNPAKRALSAKGIIDYKMLSQYTRKEVATWHGIGPSTLKKIDSILQELQLNWGK